tara:strand:- start:404 stop:679 length:276 start_codon:yes stop_codon:yes gene_type:complete
MNIKIKTSNKRLSLKKIREFSDIINASMSYNSDFIFYSEGSINTTSTHSLNDARYAFYNHDTKPFCEMIKYFTEKGINKTDLFFINLLVGE